MSVGCCGAPAIHLCLFVHCHFQGEDLQEEDGLAREQQPEDDDFLVGSETDDRFESLETETLQEGRTFFVFWPSE